MPKGRKRRMRAFGERVRAFSRDLERGVGSKDVRREVGHAVSSLSVGTGKHRRLVYKRGEISHAVRAKEYYSNFIRYFGERGHEPQHYKFVNPNQVFVGTTHGIVQEYFNKPSLNELMSYLRRAQVKKYEEERRGRPLRLNEVKNLKDPDRPFESIIEDKESALRCKQFLNDPRNKGINWGKMGGIVEELVDDMRRLEQYIKAENIIVLGQIGGKGAQKLKLAIIDF